MVAGSAERWFAPGFAASGSRDRGGHAPRADGGRRTSPTPPAACARVVRRARQGRRGEGPRPPGPGRARRRRVRGRLGAGRLRPARRHDPGVRRAADISRRPRTRPAWPTCSRTGSTKECHDRQRPVRRRHAGPPRGPRRGLRGRASERATPFTADFQRFITETAWGSVWTRPGLDRRTRSVITITALVAHGHWDELALHVVGRSPQRPVGGRDRRGAAAHGRVLRRARGQPRLRDRPRRPGRLDEPPDRP